MTNQNRHAMRFTILAFAAVVSICHVAGAQTPWRWKFSPGEVLHYDAEQHSQTETKGAGKPTSATIKMSMRLTWKVEKVDEQGAATLSQTIDRLSATMQVDKLDPIVYDSAAQSPPTGPAKEIGDSVKPILGSVITVLLNSRGEVLSVEPSSVIRDALGKTRSNQLFSPDGLMRVIQQASFVVPEQVIASGATWETVNETPSPLGQLQQTTRFTYVGPADRNGKSVEKVDTDTQLKMQKTKEGSSSSAAIQENEQRGTLWFDATAGRLVASETKQRLVTERPYREMTIRVQSVTTATTTLVE